MGIILKENVKKILWQQYEGDLSRKGEAVKKQPKAEERAE